jgi:putative cardiolipin synthase
MSLAASLAAGAGMLLALWAILWLATRLPGLPPLPEDGPARLPGGTLLGERFSATVARTAGLSGVIPLSDPVEALAARVRLIRAAEATIDIQYYIWNADISGILLLGELLEAAERGVRIRLLLDDNGIAGMDAPLAGLDAHRRVAVRLFNPFRIRAPKLINYLGDFPRLNRRMHNKALIVDGTLAIVGGRNIGDEYFGATDGDLFADLDAVVAGPVVEDLLRDYGRYWAAPSAWPATSILGRRPGWTRPGLRTRALAARARAEAGPYRPAIESPAGPDPLTRPEAYEWAPIIPVSDDPAKALGRHGGRLADRLLALLDEPQSEVGLVTPYFVPTRAGVAELAALARRGVRVSILTNSFEANNHGIVHAGYAPHRRALLEAGIRLFEARRLGAAAGPRARRRPGSLPRSGSALHAKTFAIDRQRLFIGSMNFDPRSVALNTELGVLIDEPGLAGQLMAQFDAGFPGNALAVTLEEGRLVWTETGPDGRRFDAEPGVRPHHRLVLAILARLPIDWML